MTYTSPRRRSVKFQVGDSTRREHRRLAGTGCIVAAVTAAVGRQPHIVGKPNTPMFDFACEKIFADGKRLQPDRALMIGDRYVVCVDQKGGKSECSLETDIAFANRNNIPSLCVLTGCAKKPTVETISDPELKPTYCTNSIADLLEVL